MSPENQWLEDVFPTKIVIFWGDMLVFRGVQGKKFDSEVNHRFEGIPQLCWKKGQATETSRKNNMLYVAHL